MHTILGEMQFNVGFKREEKIVFCENPRTIIIKVKAYFEEDGITAEQAEALKKYSENKIEINDTLTELAINYDKNAASRFIPKTLLFGRNGECALLCDDEMEPDEGIAICIYPEKKVVSQDDYL